MVSFETATADAAEHDIYFFERKDKVVFLVKGRDHAVAWMYRSGTQWKGYTAEPLITGTKKGRKGDVAAWCMDWAANGF